MQMMALIMTMKNKPQAVMMSFQKEYAERYDWLVTLFKDWAFTFMSSFLYYQDFDMLDNIQKQFYRQGNGGIWRYCTNLSHRVAETSYHCLGFSFASVRYANDVFFYAYR